MELKKNQHDIGAGNTVLPATLSDLGIDKMQSSRWQRASRVEPDDFEAYLRDCQTQGREVTQAGLLKLAAGAHVPADIVSGADGYHEIVRTVEAFRRGHGQRRGDCGKV